MCERAQTGRSWLSDQRERSTGRQKLVPGQSCWVSFSSPWWVDEEETTSSFVVMARRKLSKCKRRPVWATMSTSEVVAMILHKSCITKATWELNRVVQSSAARICVHKKPQKTRVCLSQCAERRRLFSRANSIPADNGHVVILTEQYVCSFLQSSLAAADGGVTPLT